MIKYIKASDDFKFPRNSKPILTIGTHGDTDKLFTQIGFRKIYDPAIIAGFTEDGNLYVIDMDSGKSWKFYTLGDKETINNIVSAFDNWDDFKDWLETNYRGKQTNGIDVHFYV